MYGIDFNSRLLLLTNIRLKVHYDRWTVPTNRKSNHRALREVHDIVLNPYNFRGKIVKREQFTTLSLNIEQLRHYYNYIAV